MAVRERTVTVADRLREIADRLLSFAAFDHSQAAEITAVVNEYDAALDALLEPCKKWPDVTKSARFVAARKAALKLYLECGGSEDVHG